MTPAILAVVLALVNPLKTPGAVRPLTVVEICGTRWGTDARHVRKSLRSRVYAAYGIPAARRSEYVVDHLIPRELGGADVFANLWPERKAAAKLKDRQENALHRAVCASPDPLITLEAARQIMSSWSRE